MAFIPSIKFVGKKTMGFAPEQLLAEKVRRAA
jgi:hypothetical protein